MNEKQARILRLVAKEVPKSIRNQLTYKKNELNLQKERAEKILNTGKFQGKFVSKETQKQIASLMERGAFERNKEEINKEVEQKMDKIIEAKVRSAIQRGDLPDPITELNTFNKERGKYV